MGCVCGGGERMNPRPLLLLADEGCFILRGDYDIRLLIHQSAGVCFNVVPILI